MSSNDAYELFNDASELFSDGFSDGTDASELSSLGGAPVVDVEGCGFGIVEGCMY